MTNMAMGNDWMGMFGPPPKKAAPLDTMTTNEKAACVVFGDYSTDLPPHDPEAHRLMMERFDRIEQSLKRKPEATP